MKLTTKGALGWGASKLASMCSRLLLGGTVLVSFAGGAAHGAMRPTPEYLKRATVYQIVLRTFTRDGNFKAATAMLDHVRSAGVDVVYLTPFVEMDCDMDETGWSPQQRKSGYHTPKNPYRISNYDKIDLEYGKDEDFQAFNDRAHALGMKVFMDLVYLHCGPNNILKDLFPDAFQKNPDGTVYRKPHKKLSFMNNLFQIYEEITLSREFSTF